MDRKKPVRDTIADLRTYQRRRDPDATTDRPTRSEADQDRTRTDYRLRTGVLRGRGCPPTPEYRAARQRLEESRAKTAEEKNTP